MNTRFRLYVTVTAFQFFATIALSTCLAALASSAKNLPNDLHRLDFRVEGASCVGCLRRIAHKFQDSKGVLKADVSIYRPYWAVVIYDAQKTNLPNLKQSIQDEHVKLVDVEDKAIASMPAFIMPKGLPSAQPSLAH